MLSKPLRLDHLAPSRLLGDLSPPNSSPILPKQHPHCFPSFAFFIASCSGLLAVDLELDAAAMETRAPHHWLENRSYETNPRSP
jgi:hypothetical protein